MDLVGIQFNITVFPHTRKRHSKQKKKVFLSTTSPKMPRRFSNFTWCAAHCVTWRSRQAPGGRWGAGSWRRRKRRVPWAGCWAESPRRFSSTRLKSPRSCWGSSSSPSCRRATSGLCTTGWAASWRYRSADTLPANRADCTLLPSRENNPAYFKTADGPHVNLFSCLFI